MAMGIPSIITTSVGTCQIEVRQVARKDGFHAPVRKTTLHTDEILMNQVVWGWVAGTRDWEGGEFCSCRRGDHIGEISLPSCGCHCNTLANQAGRLFGM